MKSNKTFFQIWLQMVAAKLEKAKEEKREKLSRLGNVIDKVVSDGFQIFDRCKNLASSLKSAVPF